MIGIENVHEFYTNHYLAAIIQNDINPVVQKWLGDAREGEDKAPHRKLAALQQSFFRYREKLERTKSAELRVEAHRDATAELLDALGYQLRGMHCHLPSGPLPVLAEYNRGDGSPLLWLLPVVSNVEDKGDPLGQEILPEQHAVVPELPADFEPEANAGKTVEELVTEAFGLDEPPRFILILGDTEWILADRGKWAEQRMLRFDMVEILGRREEATLQATAAILHQESLAPESGTALVDTLDDSSHKHAFEVSEDLKYALRESIELLGNEAIRYRRLISKKKVFGEEINGDELARECLRYMYRILFLLYVESRPELGYAPLGEDAYRLGYSFDRLRDLESVELNTEDAQEGFYIHECLRRLFDMTYNGTEAQAQEAFLGSDGSVVRSDLDENISASIHNTFRMVPLRCHIFDPSRTQFINQVKFRNDILLQIIKLMSLSRPKGKGKNKRRGRISYATLGVNQLGAVYEALLSFKGFFAEQTLFEVKPEKEDWDPLGVAYFVPKEDLGQYNDKERVFDDNGEVMSYPPGSFIYRQAGRDRQKSASYYTPEVLTKCLVKYALKELLEDENGKLKLTGEEILNLTICEPAMGSAAFLNEAVNQLSERYLQVRQKELGERIPHERYLDELQRVKMYMADNNVFGVDLNPVALELAEVSLWLNAIFSEDTPQGKNVFVPWFGGQLATGNSLVGGWRKVFSGAELDAGKKKKKESPWLEAVPERVPLGTKRPKGSVYHFLLPDKGMATYGEGSEGKPIREMCKDELKQIKTWRGDICSPLKSDEVDALARLSDAVDRLWDKHAELYAEVRKRTTDPLSVYGFEHPMAGKKPTTTEEKDKIWAKEMESQQVRAASPYRRLKLAMDYWCALWFWPIEKADLLPDREEWLADMALLLDTDVLPSLTGEAQTDLFAPTMPSDEAKKLADEVGIVDVDKLISRWPRLQVADELSKRYRFHHWELEYADLFMERGGFDLILGNPPWLRVEWKEAHVLGDVDPSFALKKMSVMQTTNLRDATLSKYDLYSDYCAAHEEASGYQAFFSSIGTYAALVGIRPNLYKCFQPVSWEIGSHDSTAGFIHEEGQYYDPAGGKFRANVYQRLRQHYQFQNQLPLFPGLNDHGTKKFSINIYSTPQQPEFLHIANLYHPSTIDSCLIGSSAAQTPSLKDENGNWETRGHHSRLIKVDDTMLTLFANLLEDLDTPSIEARLPAIHSTQLVQGLEKIAYGKEKLSSISDVSWTDMWNESRSQKSGIIERSLDFPHSLEKWVVSAPQFYVGVPLYKSPRKKYSSSNDYDPIDISSIDSKMIPRSIYTLRSPEESHSKIKLVDWECDSSKKSSSDYYRIFVNANLDSMVERTLQPAIFPPKVGHIYSVNSYAFKDTEELIRVAASWMSLPCDFFVKAIGARAFMPNLSVRTPVAQSFFSEVCVRVCLLNCLTDAYSLLWCDCFNREWLSDNWSTSDMQVRHPNTYSSLSEKWTERVPVRDYYSRRKLLIELDVLISMGLGISLEQLKLMYDVHFPRLKNNETNSWYDRNGRVIFTTNAGLRGVGLPRKKSKLYPVGPYWEDVMHMSEENGYTGNDVITQVVEDDTLPGGPYEKTIEYMAPWVRCNREKDYEEVWAHFEKRFGRKYP